MGPAGSEQGEVLHRQKSTALAKLQLARKSPGALQAVWCVERRGWQWLLLILLPYLRVSLPLPVHAQVEIPKLFRGCCRQKTYCK